MTITGESRAALSAIIGKRCWRKEVGEFRSLSLGFGAPTPSGTGSGLRVYGEWEIGTYNAAWRVSVDDDVLCGSEDAATNRDRANEVLAAIDLGSTVDWAATRGSIWFSFSAGHVVEFLRVNSDQDEWFHLFAPGNIYVELSGAGNWAVGPSSSPWVGRRLGAG